MLEEDSIGFEAEGVYVCTVGVTETDITTVSLPGRLVQSAGGGRAERAHWTDAQ